MVHEIHETHEKVLYAQEVFQIQGALFEVYRTLGAGFLEAVYQECLAIEFAARTIPFVAQRSLRLEYKGRVLRQTYTPDFVCFGKIIVELKALGALAPEHKAQTMNYLKASALRLGLLVNFGATGGVQVVRFAL
jgi:GxxExxY protein